MAQTIQDAILHAGLDVRQYGAMASRQIQDKGSKQAKGKGDAGKKGYSPSIPEQGGAHDGYDWDNMDPWQQGQGKMAGRGRGGGKNMDGGNYAKGTSQGRGKAEEGEKGKERGDSEKGGKSSKDHRKGYQATRDGYEGGQDCSYDRPQMEPDGLGILTAGKMDAGLAEASLLVVTML